MSIYDRIPIEPIDGGYVSRGYVRGRAKYIRKEQYRRRQACLFLSYRRGTLVLKKNDFFWARLHLRGAGA
jgi:hypothetical protein